MKNLTKLLVIIFCFLLIFILIVFYDNTHQKESNINTNTLTLRNEMPVIKNAYTPTHKERLHLQSLGFSDYSIMNLSKNEAENYLKVNGKIVSSRTYYDEISEYGGKKLNKEKYIALLKKKVNGSLINNNALFRTNYTLYETSRRNFFVVGEMHIDYAPFPLSETLLTVQSDYSTIHSQNVKQIWWTTSSLKKDQWKIHSKSYNSPNGIANNSYTNDKFDDTYYTKSNSQSYTLSWHKPKLFEDTIGMHYFYTATISIPKGYRAANIAFKIQNPSSSAYLSRNYKSWD